MSAQETARAGLLSQTQEGECFYCDAVPEPGHLLCKRHGVTSRPREVMEGGARLLAALRDISAEHRLDALAVACKFYLESGWL